MTRTLRIFPQTNANVEWDALSLFDGMSCAQIALREMGITPRKYYASEIDKHAIGQTQLNFPDTIQLGDVTKWREWDIDWANINLLMAGSPCQGFSMAGKRLAFDDPRSALFFVFIDILNHIRKFNPDVIFLLENVNMKKSHRKVINDYCGLHGVRINSSRVSAQMRDRWYWSNIRTRQDGLFGEIHTDIPQPEDRGIFLRDILETEVDEKYYLSDKAAKFITDPMRLRKRFTAINGDKSLPLRVRSIEGWQGTYIAQRPRGKNKGGIHTEKSPNLSSNAWEQNNMVVQLNPSKESGDKQPYQQNRVYNPCDKSPALLAGMSCGTHAVAVGDYRIRRLTPTECARLQTIPEWYKWKCSESQQYKMLGNGWSIEAIKHILSFLPAKYLPKSQV